MHILSRSFTTSLLVIVCLSLLAGSCSGRKDLSGNWNGRMTLAETGKSLDDLQIELNQKGEELSGTLNFTKVEAAKVKLAGKHTDTTVTFKTEYKRGLSMSFSGTVASGSKIRGTAVLYYNDPKIPIKQDTVSMEITRR